MRKEDKEDEDEDNEGSKSLQQQGASTTVVASSVNNEDISPIPHQIRGSVASYEQICPTVRLPIKLPT